jgi:secondary thiamine-phosphate synthase enzyme
MRWHQSDIIIPSNGRGFHLVTNFVINNIPAILEYKIGILHLFLKHTSASISINENTDPTVRQDLESHFNMLVPENQSYYKHTYEGPDDMPAHIKSTIIGNTVTVPISNGELTLGAWQGIYLCEHRISKQDRKIVATIYGEK